jgi:outer membrane protein assembly factor BamB
MALIGGAGLLAGCETFDSLVGTRKTPLPGERLPILRSEGTLGPDRGVDPLGVALPAPQARADWPMAGGPSTHVAGHGVLAEGARLAWRADAGSGSGYRARLAAGPIVAAGRVVTVDAFATVSAFALADGSRFWRTGTEREREPALPMGGGAAIADGTVFVATPLAEILALSLADGTILWRAPLPAPARSAPTVAAGRIFVATAENHLLALSAANGDRLWTYRAAPALTMPFGLGAPAVDGETVVAGFGSGEMAALRAADGRVLWIETLGAVGSTSLGDLSGIVGQPVIDRDRVLAVGTAGITIAVDLRSGRRLWERAFGGDVGVAAAGDFLFAVTRGGTALALGRDDGRIRWATDLDPSPEGGRRRVVARFGPPILAGGRVLVPSSRGEVLGLDPRGGAIAQRIPVSSSVTLPAALVEGTLLLLGDDATLMALR